MAVVAAKVCWLSAGLRGQPTVLLFGDSHAAHWWSAVAQFGESHGVRVGLLSKSGCPAPQAPVLAEGQPYPQCALWRESALQLIATIKPAAVIMASSYGYEGLLLAAGAPVTAEQLPSVWADATGQTLARISPATQHVFVLRDLPRFPDTLIACMDESTQPGSDCALPLAQAVSPAAAEVFTAEQQAVAAVSNAHGVDLTSLICSDGVCSPVQTDGVRRYRDGNHLEPGFARGLWPAISGAVAPRVRLVAAPPDAVAAHVGANGLTVRWRRPPSPGTDALTGYRIVVRDGAAQGRSRSCDTGARATSCRVAGLDPRGRYTITVRALTSIGAGIPAQITLSGGSTPQFAPTPSRIRGQGRPSVRLRARMSPPGRYPVVLQQMSGAPGRWRTVARRTTSRSGTALVSVPVPQGKSRWRWVLAGRDSQPRISSSVILVSSR